MSSSMNFDFLQQKPAPSVALKVLRESPLFASLDDEELEGVVRCVVDVSVPADGIVIHEGTPGENLYIVRSGKLRVDKEVDGKRLSLGELGPGAAFGEMSLIHAAPTSATVTAIDDSRLLAIGRLDLNVLLNWNPILAAKMWRSFTEMLATRLRDMNERMLQRFGDTH